MEVKGWTGDTWRRALKAWEASQDTATQLDAEQKRLVAQLRAVIKQLTDAAKEPRGKPFLIYSNKLKGATKVNLDDFLSDNMIEVQIKLIDEMEMLAAAKRLRAAFNLPEKLPVETGGGVP